MVTRLTTDDREDIMFKDLSIENWIVGGSAFILIFTIGCFVWFQFQMSTVEIYDSQHEVEIQHIDETSDTELGEIQHIEINDTEENDTTGNNSTDSEVMDDEYSDATDTYQKFRERRDTSAYAQRQHITLNSQMRLFILNT